MKSKKLGKQLLALYVAVIINSQIINCAVGARLYASLSQESLHLARTQTPCSFTTVVLSAPREEGIISYQSTGCCTAVA